MATPTQPAKPLDLLRHQITTLEAAITLALADPKPKTVHLLRTSTRRIEAQFALLNLLTKDRRLKHLKKATRRLAQLRRAAGQVRDLDVARDLLKDPAALQTAASRHRVGEDLAATASLHRQLERDAKSLRTSIRHQRPTAADILVALLHRRGSALASSLEALLESLALSDETSSLSVSPARLTTLTEDWTRSQLPTEPDPDPTPKSLHDIRKVIKLARYMAESTPATASLAHTFEALQQAGGTWLDYLHLHDLARHKLGKHSPLAALLSHLTASSLAAYQAQLAIAPALGDGHHRSKII